MSNDVGLGTLANVVTTTNPDITVRAQRDVTRTEHDAYGNNVEVVDHFERDANGVESTHRDTGAALPPTTYRSAESYNVQLRTKAKSAAKQMADLREIFLKLSRGLPQPYGQKILVEVIVGFQDVHRKLQKQGMVTQKDTDLRPDTSALSGTELVDRLVSLVFRRGIDTTEAAIYYFDLDRSKLDVPTYADYDADPVATVQRLFEVQAAMAPALKEIVLPDLEVPAGATFVFEPGGNVNASYKSEDDGAITVTRTDDVIGTFKLRFDAPDATDQELAKVTIYERVTTKTSGGSIMRRAGSALRRLLPR